MEKHDLLRPGLMQALFCFAFQVIDQSVIHKQLAA
jgi:hypothetical protein